MLVHLSHLTMRNSQVKCNKLIGDVATTDDIAPVGSALEVSAASSIINSNLVGNSVRIHSDHGSAMGTSGLAVYDFTETGDPGQVVLRHVNVVGTTTVARSNTGSAAVMGAGIFNNSLLMIHDSQIRGNRGSASAPHPRARGGGIWNGVFLSGPRSNFLSCARRSPATACTSAPEASHAEAGSSTRRPLSSTTPSWPRTDQTSATDANAVQLLPPSPAARPGQQIWHTGWPRCGQAELPRRQLRTSVRPITAKNTVWMLWTAMPSRAVRYRLAG